MKGNAPRRNKNTHTHQQISHAAEFLAWDTLEKWWYIESQHFRSVNKYYNEELERQYQAKTLKGVWVKKSKFYAKFWQMCSKMMIELQSHYKFKEIIYVQTFKVLFSKCSKQKSCLRVKTIFF